MKNGIALVTAMIVMIILLLVGGTVLYISLKNLQILSSGRRVESTMEAAEAVMEAGIEAINRRVSQGEALMPERTYNFGKYRASLQIVPFYNEFVIGSGIEFSTGYEPMGTETSRGGMSKIYMLLSEAEGPRGEKRKLQALYRKIVGVAGR